MYSAAQIIAAVTATRMIEVRLIFGMSGVVSVPQSIKSIAAHYSCCRKLGIVEFTPIAFPKIFRNLDVSQILKTFSFCQPVPIRLGM
jgi:hypothetical protein